MKIIFNEMKADKIIEFLERKLTSNNNYSRSEIEDLLKNENLNGQNPTSMSYNRWNKGMKKSNYLPLFIYEGRNKYKFVGSKFPYTGKTYNHKNEWLAKWINGKITEINNELIDEYEILNH